MTRKLSPRLRWRILERDGYRCTYCGGTPADGLKLQVDHIRAWSSGGSDDPSNLVTACEPCNQGKSDLPLDPERAARDSTIGASCPTRLRIAATAHYYGSSYAKVAGLSLETVGTYSPPSDREDGMWMDAVRADPRKYLRWIADAIDAIFTGSPAPVFAVEGATHSGT